MRSDVTVVVTRSGNATCTKGVGTGAPAGCKDYRPSTSSRLDPSNLLGVVLCETSALLLEGRGSASFERSAFGFEAGPAQPQWRPAARGGECGLAKGAEWGVHAHGGHGPHCTSVA